MPGFSQFKMNTLYTPGYIIRKKGLKRRTCRNLNWTGDIQKLLLQLKQLRESNLQLIPAELREYLKMLLSATPELRPNAAQFSKIGYFDDIGVKTLNNLV